MPEPVSPFADREKPLGLLDLWRLRKGNVCRRELQQLRQSPYAWFRPALLAGFFTVFVSGLIGGCLIAGHDPPPHIVRTTNILAAISGCALLGAVVLAAGSGVHVFARERTGGTLASLALTAIPRREIVGGRLCASLRPYFVLLCVLAAFVAIPVFFLGVVVLVEGSFVPLVGAVCLGGMWLFYISLLLLGAVIGLCCGLRIESTVGAHLLGLSLLLGVCLADAGLLALAALRVSEWAPLVGVLPLAVVNFGMASALLNRTACNFDAWAARD